jgi:putative ATP-binding cassette transporter
LLAWVVLLSAVALSVGAYETYLNRDITNALMGKHLALFHRGMMFAAAAAIIGVLAKVLREYVGNLLYIEWREWLTRYFINEGFSHRTFYRTGVVGKADNPDQRTSDDIGSFVESTEFFTVTLAFAMAGVVTYHAWRLCSRGAKVVGGLHDTQRKG